MIPAQRLGVQTPEDTGHLVVFTQKKDDGGTRRREENIPTNFRLSARMTEP